MAKPTRFCVYYLTYECQAMCPFCDVWQKPAYRDLSPTTTEQVLANLEVAKQAGAKEVYFTGGEPLLVPDLPFILQHAKSLGFFTSLSTNGILYESVAPQWGSALDLVYFSLDSSSASQHDAARGVGVFQRVLRGVKLAKQLPGEVKLRFTLSSANVGELPDMVVLAETLEVPVSLSFIYDFFGAQGFSKGTYPYIKRYLLHPQVELNLAALAWVRRGGNRTMAPRCMAEQAVISFGPDGSRFSPCRFYDHASRKVAGEVRQGRGLICEGCMRWDYFLPSFYHRYDQYRLLQACSDWLLHLKKQRGLFSRMLLNWLKLFW